MDLVELKDTSGGNLYRHTSKEFLMDLVELKEAWIKRIWIGLYWFLMDLVELKVSVNSE